MIRLLIFKLITSRSALNLKYKRFDEDSDKNYINLIYAKQLLNSIIRKETVLRRPILIKNIV